MDQILREPIQQLAIVDHAGRILGFDVSTCSDPLSASALSLNCGCWLLSFIDFGSTAIYLLLLVPIDPTGIQRNPNCSIKEEKNKKGGGQWLFSGDRHLHHRACVSPSLEGRSCSNWLL